MCLGVPMQVTSINIDDNSAVVEFGGTRLEVRLDICDQLPQVADYVIVHAGYAIHWIDPDEAKITQQIFLDALAAEDAANERACGVPDSEPGDEDEDEDDEVDDL